MPRTPRDDRKGYAFIVFSFALRGRGPSMQMIADEMGYGSKRSAQLMIRRLTKAGLVRYEKGALMAVASESLLASYRHSLNILAEHLKNKAGRTYDILTETCDALPETCPLCDSIDR